MSSFDSDKSQEGSPLEDALWTADGDGDSSVHPQVNPGFDNAEADEVLHDSFEGPTDVDPREPGEQEAPKKKSNMGFYAAVGGFVIAAVGLVGYKSGLLTSGSKKPIEPISMAAAMPDESPKKHDSLMVAAAPAGAASGDVLGSASTESAGARMPGSSFDAEADLLAERPAAPATPAPAVLAPAPAAAPEPAAPVAAPAMPVAAVAPAAATAPVTPTKVAEAPATPAVVEKPVVAAAPAAKPEPKVTEPKAATAPESAPRKAVKTAKSQPSTARVVAKQAKASKPVVVAKASKPSKSKRIEKDATPDGKEVLAGWKLRGTWPSQGPNQLAWIADEQGRLITVAVGQRISGARVLSIGKRGEVVQTTAGQILP